MRRHTSKRLRPAFTIVELLVVIAVISILIALILPAVQQARESARSMSCRSNLKQIGLALQNYLDANSVYPPSFCIEASTVLSGNNGSWSIHGRLLPFLEKTNEYTKVRLDIAWDAQRGTGIPTMRIPNYFCPSDPGDQVRVDSNGKPKVYPQTYGFNFGTWLVYDPTSAQRPDGAFFVNSSTKPAHFKDGMTYTLCLAEVNAFTSYFRNTADPGAAVPDSTTLISGFAAGGAQFKLGKSINDNTGHTEWCDGRVHHSGFTTTFTPNSVVSYLHSDGNTYDIDFNSMQEGKSITQPTYAAVTSRSHHSNIVNVTMMDGSVRSVNDDIDLAIWRALGTRIRGPGEPQATEF